MTGLLTDPTCAIVVGDEMTVGDVQSAVCEGRTESGVGVATAERAIEVLTKRDDVGCVVVTDSGSDDVERVCESILEHDDLYPMVVVAEDGSEDLAHRVTRAGALEYVPAPVDDDVLRTIVDDAIERYDRRRWQAADSDMLLTLMEAFDGAMYAKDPEGRHYRKVSVPGDYNPEEFVGKTDVDVYGEREREALEDDIRIAETGEPIVDKECRFETPNGYRWSRSTKVPWYDDGEIRGTVGITRDVTEEVERRQRLERHQQQLERVAKSFTHDLRTPLQVASGYLEMARETGDDTAFEEADRALRRMDDMLEDLTDIAPGRSRGSCPDGEWSLETTKLPELIEDVWSVGWSDEATLESRFFDGAVATVSEQNLRPVFENLLKNAVSHAGEDPTVRVGPLPEGGFFVEDDGPGISEDERDAVLEQGYTTAEDGSGLGLAIVADVADRHDWTIDITESEAGGARFEIRNCPIVPEPDRGFEPETTLELNANTDVGPVAVEGEIVDRDGDERIVVESGGQNIYGQVNEFHFVHAAVDGPVRLQARVETLDNVAEWSTAGLMVRQDLAEDAAYGFVGATQTHGTGLLWRHRRGGHGGSFHFEEPSTFSWYRIERDGERVTVAASEDGAEWIPLDQHRIELAEPCYIGLVLCSNKPGECARAVFEDVSLSALESVEE